MYLSAQKKTIVKPSILQYAHRGAGLVKVTGSGSGTGADPEGTAGRARVG